MVIDTLLSLFVPARIGRYALIRRKVGTFKITTQGVYLTLVSAYHQYRDIQQAHVIPLAGTPAMSERERMLDTLREALTYAGKLDEVYFVISSDMVVTKELTVPFVDPEKIELIAPFEVEPSLPFAASEAVITTLIMYSDTAQQESKVLVCAANRTYVQELVTIARETQTPLQGISVAIVELAALYQSIPDYQLKQATGGTVILHVHEHMTEYLVYDAQQRLVHMRIGMIGFSHARFFDDVSVMLDQAAHILGTSVEKIYVLPEVEDTAVWMKQFNDQLHVTAQLIQPRLITHYPKVSASAGVNLETSWSDAVTPGLHIPHYADFSLLVRDFKPDESYALLKQLITSSVLGIGGLVAVITSTAHVRGVYAREIQNSQNQVRTLLVKELGLPDTAKRLPLTQLNNQAINKVTAEQDIWSSLSAEHRASMLHYLEELSRRLDLQKLGLTITHIAINDVLQTLLLEGSVRDFDALHALQDELERIPYFEYVPRAQDTKFSLKIILKPTLE